MSNLFKTRWAKIISLFFICSILVASIARQDFAINEPNPSNAIDMPVSKLHISNAKVSEVIDLLRNSYYIAISFIEAVDDQRVTIILENGTVQDVLERIVAQSPEYRYKVINGRLILYPNHPNYEIIVTGVDIANTPRIDAARLYIDYLKSKTEEFEKLSGVLMIGNLKSPTYSAIVSLSTESSVISHFVEILGIDPFVVFSIRLTKSGYFVFFLEEIISPPQRNLDTENALSTTCRPLSITYANQQNTGCGYYDPAYCGARIIYDITGVITCPGDNCAGKRVTESATRDRGCVRTGPDVEIGPGCSIGTGNTINGCTDEYALCAPISDITFLPNGQCGEMYRQTLYVDGVAVETCNIVFVITKHTDGTCSGTVKRFCTQLNSEAICGCSTDCDSMDGWYCNGTSKEYRDYSCSQTTCVYSVTQTNSCVDNNSCTNDTCSGGICSNTAITSCIGGDGCCPSGCTSANDSDCPTLIDLISFTATPYDSYVVLEWQTDMEIDNAGFNIWRSLQENGEYTKINEELIPAQGSGSTYTFTDTDVAVAKTYYYKLEDIDLHGTSTLHGPVSATINGIRLVSPENGAIISLKTPVTFTWESVGFNKFRLEFSNSPDFTANTITLPKMGWKLWVDGWITDNFYTPSKWEWTWLYLKSLRNGKTIYWRVYGEDESGNSYTSEANNFEIQRNGRR